jgi:deoxyribose-phosphate aldolase
MKIFEGYHQNSETIANRLKEMLSIPSEGEGQQGIYLECLGLIDLTTLEGSDTQEKIGQLCNQARFSAISKTFPDAAAVCVYPALVSKAVKYLKGTRIRVASVAGAFPSGQTSLHVKLEEIKFAVGEGADEIDTVISRGKLIEGREEEVFDEIAAIREGCGDKHLKVILETGELPSIAMVRKASELAILAGADFIKTSTGKINTGATPDAFLIMLDTIREYLEKTGKAIGIKPAGGIRTPEQALVYYRLVREVLGEQWLNKDYFRIGASSLAGELIKKGLHP